MSAKYGVITNADVDASENLAVIDVAGFSVLWVSFIVGVANLSAFAVDGCVVGATNFFPLASASGNYTTPVGAVLAASGDLTTAGFGSTVHHVKLDVRGLQTIRLRGAGTSSTVNGHYRLF